MLGASKKMEGAKDKDKDKVFKNSSKENKRKVFKIPSEDEVAVYCKERSNSISVKKFIAFYQSKGWMIGKNKMKDWKAAVRSWEQADQNTNSTVKSTSRAYIQESDKNRDRDF